MPRKPRIEIPGYYHIINRGVEQRTVFRDEDDYDYFLELLCTHAKHYGIAIHNYCLMSNHYHLLIEIKHENLSKFMRQLGSDYAVYFNKKNKRTGHLWQGRFKSQYVTDETYLYTLILYIEQNPLKANLVNHPEEYPYSSAHQFLSPTPNPCLAKAWITTHYQEDTGAIRAYLNAPIDSSQLHELKRASTLVEASNSTRKPDITKLQKQFEKTGDIQARNRQIVTSYHQGYSQHAIAKVLGISQAAVYGVIKRSRR